MSTPASTSRYSRTPRHLAAGPGEANDSEPSGDTPPRAVAAPTTHAHTPGAADAQFQALMARMEQLKTRRVRREVELDHAKTALAQCEAQAHALGVDSLEALEALVARLEAEDQAALEAFQQALDQEQALLDDIDHKLAALGAAG